MDVDTSAGDRFAWRRWWYPEGEDLATSGGFLDDPAGPLAKYFDSSLVELDNLDAARCLVLLGEPGIGKSSELSRTEQRLTAEGVAVAHFDLGQFPDLAALRDAILTDAQVVAWMACSSELVLLLDGFDEAAGALSKLADGLSGILGTLPLERLTLRITSRSSVWSGRLDDELRKTWPNRQRLVLAPLTASDVAAAALTRLSDDRFLAAVDERDLGVLAARPLTLDMLINVSEQHGVLPVDRTQLYEQATRLLAAENHTRRVEERTARFSADERLALARRLAAASLLSGRAVIHRTRHPDTPASDLAVDDIVAAQAEQDAFIEVLDTGLFTAATGGAVRWTHRSIAEFLAAQQLAELPVATIDHLLSDPFAPGRIAPPLAGTASWVAALNSTFYTTLVEREPDLLLSANLLTASAQQRQELTRSLLRDLNARTPVDRRRYHNLGYPGLGADVAPFLAHQQERWVRREAAHLLADARCRDLDERLVEILEATAADHPPSYLGPDLSLATTVAFALDDATDPTLLDRLVVIVTTPDAPWQLRADILAQLWGRVDTDRLLTAVSDIDLPSHRERRLGRAVAEELATAIHRGRVSLPELIDWLSTTAFHQLPPTRISSAWRPVAEATALIAAQIDTIDDAQLQRCAAMARAWLHTTHELFDSYGNDPRLLPDEARHRLTRAWWTLNPDTYELHHLVTSGLLAPTDLAWLLRELGHADPTSPAAASIIATIGFFVMPDPEQAATAEALAVEIPGIASFVADRFSAERVQAAIHEQTRREREQAAKNTERAQAEFNEARLAAALTASDWSAITRELQLPVGRDQWPHGASLTRSPAWAKSNPQVRQQIIDAAAAYLARLSSPVSAQGADDVAHAFELVHGEAADRLGAADRATLMAWLAVVRDRIGVDHAVNAMIDWLTPTHPTDIETLLLDGIARDTSANHFPFQLRRLGQFTSPAIADALDRLAHDPVASPALVSEAVAALIRRDDARGTNAAFSIIERRPNLKPSHNLIIDPTNAVLRRWRQSVAACAALIESEQCAARLDDILAALSASPEFAIDVIATTESSARHRPWAQLSCDQLATLYLWARAALPPEPDHPDRGVVTSNPVHEFAGTVFRTLQERIEPTAIDALNRIATDTNEPWGRSAAARVANQLRENTWQPLPPQDVLAIIDQPAHRAITTEAQLGQLLLEAIDEIQHELDTSPDFAALFWHRQHAPPGQPATWIPRSETEFTTAVLLERLDRKLNGVILRQEGQLNLRYGDTEGSELDIEAVVLHDGVEICVIVEVKGLWHKHVETAIEKQLADRYLTGRRSSTGIYLVAVFESAHWDPKDWRLKTCRSRDLPKLIDSLAADADRLATNGRTIHVRIMTVRL